MTEEIPAREPACSLPPSAISEVTRCGGVFRMHELRAEVEELAQYHDLMRRNTAELKEALQDLRMKVGTGHPRKYTHSL